MKWLYIAPALLAVMLAGFAPMETLAQQLEPPVLQADGDIEGIGLTRKLLTAEEMEQFTTDMQEATSKEERREIQDAFRQMVLERARVRGIEMRAEQAGSDNSARSGSRAGGREAGAGNSGGRGSGSGGGSGRSN